MNELVTTLAEHWTIVLESSLQHVTLSLIALFLAILISVPVGVLLTRYRKLAVVVLGIVAVLQPIPRLALIAFLIPVFGMGPGPAIIAMVAYALLPILRNTYVGIREVDASLLEVGRGMGMTRFQLLRMLELPLARPTILAGVRTATVMTIGLATLSSLIGGGGLGGLILRGISKVDTGLILAGALPVAVLAILFDLLLARIDRMATPKGLRVRKDQNRGSR